MAKKSSTPPPPRPVQSPKPRGRESSGSSGGKGTWIGIGVLVVVLIAGAGGYAVIGRGKSSQKTPVTKGVAAAMTAAGCSFHTYPSAGRTHITTLTPANPPKYNSFPPTSGPHYYIPAVWGNYDSPVIEYQAVHNLEHGGIVIQYGPGVSKSDIAKINSFYSSDPVALLVAPFPKLGNKIALTAWTHLSLCSSFDENAFKTFRDTLRYQGPERFPPSALQPGT